MARRLHSIPVGRQKALAGLTWRETPGDTPQETREQIRSAAEALRSRFGALVTGMRPEVGMVPELAQKEGRGGISAAAWLADALIEPVLYIEALPGGLYWIVATQANYVDPRTDEICNEDEARNLVDSLLDAFSMQADTGMRVVINGERKPASMMLDRIGQTENKTFAELVAGSPPPAHARIRQLVGITPAAVIASITVLVLIGAGYAGYVGWNKWQEKRDFEARVAALAVQEAERARLKTEAELRMKLAVDEALRQDTATPAPDDLVRQCLQRMQGLGPALGGWDLTMAECAASGNAVTLAAVAPTPGRGIGTAATLLDAAGQYGVQATINPSAPNAQVLASLQAAAQRTPLKPAQLPAYTPTLRSLLSRLMLARAGTGAINYTMSAPSPRTVLYIDPELESRNDASKFKPVPDERTYLKGTVRIDGTGAWVLQALSLDYPFLTITKAQITRENNAQIKWHLEAEYVASR